MVPEVLLPTAPALLVARNHPYIHRDLSWLQFNDRVLSEARQAANPLLERAKFLAISATNLDEFFMIRFSSLNRSIALARKADPKQEARLLRIRQNLLASVLKFGNRQKETLKTLRGELATFKIFVVRKPDEKSEAFELGKKIFSERILPELTSPEPFTLQQVSGLENLQMGILTSSLQWLRIPKTLPLSFVLSPSTGKNSETYFYFLEDLIRSHLPAAMNDKGPLGVLRLTRDGDISVDLKEEDPESIPDALSTSIKVRDKGKPVRLQHIGSFPGNLLHRLSHAFRLAPEQVLPAPSSLCLHGLWTLFREAPPRADAKQILRYPPMTSFIPKQFRKTETIFDRLKDKDYLFHHPYDSFDGFVSWIQEACSDPKVESIKLTVYRIDTLSPIIEALKATAKKKKIQVIIELQARFDELNNLKLAEELKKAGVAVSFGIAKLKVHAKLALVRRNEGSAGDRLYAHLSTGNYNAMTARQYTDLALITGNQEVAGDVKTFFDSVWQGKTPTSLKHLVSAPTALHRKLLSLIDTEVEAAKAGKKAKIFAKVNALVDEALVAKLYEASKAGVQMDLIVRGACALIPGVKGLSENIRVVSIVDRFLEHSRIYQFENSKVLYLSSADWMPRNFFSRLELAFPILDERLYRYLDETLIPIYMNDTSKARELTSSGTWKKRSASGIKAGDRVSLPAGLAEKMKNNSAQEVFEALAAAAYTGTILDEKKLRGATLSASPPISPSASPPAK